MKRVGNLWDKVIDIDNLILAAHKAMEGKSDHMPFSAKITMVDKYFSFIGA